MRSARAAFFAESVVPDFAPEAWQAANQAWTVNPVVTGAARPAQGRGTGLLLVDSSFPVPVLGIPLR
ncbi:hypothetical protein [Methylobacterium sp. J-001]|uniref:hypothetical protein n=1 Tax=Methylobacterium sp. J-001 TaxID=2836609 RepID=UPI001FB99DA2|nr:hypothetical protein [Methylobacterium sp. J-001]